MGYSYNAIADNTVFILIHLAVVGSNICEIPRIFDRIWTYSYGSSRSSKVIGGIRCAVAEWYGAGLAIARSRVRIPPAAAVYQRQLSVPSLRGRLMNTSESWGVNWHTTRCTSPVSLVLQLRLVPGWGLRKRRSAPPHGPLRLGKGLYFTLQGHRSRCQSKVHTRLPISH